MHLVHANGEHANYTIAAMILAVENTRLTKNYKVVVAQCCHNYTTLWIMTTVADVDASWQLAILLHK